MKFPCKVYVEFSNLARVLGGGRLEQNWMKGFRQIARLSTSSKTKWPESVLSGSLDLSDFFLNQFHPKNSCLIARYIERT